MFRGQRISALDQVLENERELRSLLGLPVEDGSRLVPIDSPTLAFYQPDWDTSLNEALVLRPELVADSETVSRFYREIEVAGQLPEHPNLIRAFDAGPFGATHFLAMEYVAGTDLERLVKQSGPLSIAQASDCIRQAALGLQHAHQHGLVHRDIKPSNLLVSGGPGSAQTIKILDLGLARLQGDVARFATLKLATVVMRRGIERYREKNQGPILARASVLFAGLTDGSFTRLQIDDDVCNSGLVQASCGGTLDVTAHSITWTGDIPVDLQPIFSFKD